MDDAGRNKWSRTSRQFNTCNYGSSGANRPSATESTHQRGLTDEFDERDDDDVNVTEITLLCEAAKDRRCLGTKICVRGTSRRHGLRVE